MTDEAAKPDRQAERAAARGTQSNPTAVPEEVRYTVEALTEAAPQLLGVSRHALAGALYGATKRTFTLDEAKGLVSKFLNRPTEPPADDGGDA